MSTSDTAPTLAEFEAWPIQKRLRAPAYWMSGSGEGHEGENNLPFEAADEIDRLSATIKRLETPVADGEVRLAVADLERHWRETPNKELQKWLVDLARLLESQAREIEAAKAELSGWAEWFENTNNILSHAELKANAADIRAFLFHSAALSLDSVETREMKP